MNRVIVTAAMFFSGASAQIVEKAQLHMRENILPNGTVIASPSSDHPRYYYFWVRDAALVMNVVEDRSLMFNYIDLSLRQQTAGSLGEPRFNVDGSVNTEPWARPQNDGSALRALTTIKFAQELIAKNQFESLRQKLYDGRIPTDSLIKRDLEYVAHHWRERCFDLWEETSGLHFYTLMAQKSALLAGAGLADQLKDGGAAAFYREQGKAIDTVLARFWDASRGYVVNTLEQASGPDHSSGLDIAVILAALHSGQAGEPFTVTDDRILATAFQLKKKFAGIYKINQLPEFSELGTAIGRYPEDRYNGYEVTPIAQGGNPWFLATSAYAELYYRASSEFQRLGQIQITSRNKLFFDALNSGQTLQVGQVLVRGDSAFLAVTNALIKEGDRFIARVRTHMDGDHQSEQMYRDTGYMQGARDLSWSYAGFITALSARPK